MAKIKNKKEDYYEFLHKTRRVFSVEIYSAEETTDGEPVTLACYDKDIQLLINSLMADSNFLRATQDKSSEEIKTLVEIIICHKIRVGTRTYGLPNPH